MSDHDIYSTVVVRSASSQIRLGDDLLGGAICAASTGNLLEDYAALEEEFERLRQQVAALQSDANSWQSGYDKGREDGAKGWKSQHARDSAGLRRLCAERDEQWRIRRDVEADRDTANAISAELRAERDALRQQLADSDAALRDKLTGLLLGLKVSVRDRAAGRAILVDDVYELIDAALAELTP